MNCQKTPITRANVREASERFLRNGGAVVRLVPQRIPAAAIVGAKWGQFEPLAGLVLRRIEGREHWLRVDWDGLEHAYQWLHYFRHFWGGRLDSLADYFQRNNFQSHKEKK